jgi:hypothetical protein
VGDRVSLALIHHPVYNKRGDVIASAVSNLDLHDISRAAKTYGIETFYVVTPLTDQQALVKRITSHWTQGAGAVYNPDRKAALELIKVVGRLEDAVDDLRLAGGGTPLVLATDARFHAGSISFRRCSEMLAGEVPVLILFGTAWGLSRQIMEGADYILEPIVGPTDYNHLSVRSAVAIVLDRFFRGRPSDPAGK